MTNVQIRNWQISLIKDNHATIDSAQSYSHDGIIVHQSSLASLFL